MIKSLKNLLTGTFEPAICLISLCVHNSNHKSTSMIRTQKLIPPIPPLSAVVHKFQSQKRRKSVPIHMRRKSVPILLRATLSLAVASPRGQLKVHICTALCFGSKNEIFGCTMFSAADIVGLLIWTLELGLVIRTTFTLSNCVQAEKNSNRTNDYGNRIGKQLHACTMGMQRCNFTVSKGKPNFDPRAGSEILAPWTLRTLWSKSNKEKKHPYMLPNFGVNENVALSFPIIEIPL